MRKVALKKTRPKPSAACTVALSGTCPATAIMKKEGSPKSKKEEAASGTPFVRKCLCRFNFFSNCWSTARATPSS